MIDVLSPYGAPLAGGLLIGLAAGGLYLLQGQIAGVSGIARSALTRSPEMWRWAFLLGLILAGVVQFLMGGRAAPALTNTPLSLLVVAGLLVGFGTGIGTGCTSGHGVCGLARLSGRSLVAVAVFMTAASLTVFVMRHLVVR